MMLDVTNHLKNVCVCVCVSARACALGRVLKTRGLETYISGSLQVEDEG